MCTVQLAGHHFFFSNDAVQSAPFTVPWSWTVKVNDDEIFTLH